MNIPKDKLFPIDSVQCDACGGNGCKECGNRGWFTPKDHPDGRRCANPHCNNPIPPEQIAIYCSNGCAASDA